MQPEAIELFEGIYRLWRGSACLGTPDVSGEEQS